jgi:hypothetical protein
MVDKKGAAIDDLLSGMALGYGRLILVPDILEWIYLLRPYL